MISRHALRRLAERVPSVDTRQPERVAQLLADGLIWHNAPKWAATGRTPPDWWLVLLDHEPELAFPLVAHDRTLVAKTCLTSVVTVKTQLRWRDDEHAA